MDLQPDGDLMFDVGALWVASRYRLPLLDFAAVTRGFGWWAEGPVADPDRISPAVARAAEHVASTGGPALVDVLCQPK